MKYKNGILGIIIVFLTACSTEPIHKKFNLNTNNDTDRAVGLALDARQRAIISVDISSASSPMGQVKPKQIVCAEPSPDVAVAIAEAFSLGLSGNIVSKGEVAGALSKASTESLAELGKRTATVQLLRDLLYRSCEAYANGAITDASYAAVLSGIDEFTATLFLAEAAAGTTGGQGALITGGKITAEGNANINYTTEVATKEGQEPPAGEEGDKSSSSAKPKAEADKATGTASQTDEANKQAAEKIAQIHKQFIESPNPGALTLACMTAMDRRVMRKTRDQTYFKNLTTVPREEQLYENDIPSGKLQSDIDVLTTDVILHEGYPDPELAVEWQGPETHFIKFCKNHLEEIIAGLKPTPITKQEKSEKKNIDSQIKAIEKQLKTIETNVKMIDVAATTLNNKNGYVICKELLEASKTINDKEIFTKVVDQCLAFLH